MMKTSVVVTAYCRSDLLYQWFKSLMPWLKINDCEVIVLNDGMPDENRDVAEDAGKSIPVKYIYTGQRNWNGPISRPMGYAANVGIREAAGEIVVLANCDVYHLNDTLTPLIKVVERDPLAIATVCQVYDDDGRLLPLLQNGQSISQIVAELKTVDRTKDPFCSHPDQPFMMAVRKEHLLAVGGYDEDFYGYACEDCDLMFRLLDSGLHYASTPGECVHLYHGRKTTEEVEPLASYRYNLALMKSRRGHLVRNQHRTWGRRVDQPTDNPIHLTLFVTTRCILKCPLCSQKNVMQEPWDLDIGELQHLIESCQSRGVHFRCVEVTGGEPTLWTHFEEGMRLLKESGIADDLTFITNGHDPQLAVRVAWHYAPWYFVSLQQATPEQAAFHRANGPRIFWNQEVHRPQPTKPYTNSLPCGCGATTSRWGERCLSLAYFRQRVYYCCMAMALEHVTGVDPKVSCPFDEDFLDYFSDKKYDRPICSVCMNNSNIWNRL